MRERLRAERVDKLAQARNALTADSLEPMIPQEIQTEIDACRTDVRRATGS